MFILILLIYLLISCVFVFSVFSEMIFVQNLK